MRRFIASAFFALLTAVSLALPAFAENRVTWYYGEQPSDQKLNQEARNLRLGLGTDRASLFGSNGGYFNLVISPVTGLYVNVAIGSASGLGALYQPIVDDTTAQGGGPINPASQLAADPTTILGQALVSTASPNLGPLSVPSTSGYSTISLIECQITTINTTPMTTNFVTQVGTTTSATVNRDRVDAATCQAKTGTAAASPTVPSTDSGWIAIGYVTVPQGTTTITTAMVTMLAPAGLAGVGQTVAGELRTVNATQPPYNAVCDGSTDASAAMQAALVAAEAYSQGQLVWTGNCKLISAGLVANSNVRIQGFKAGETSGSTLTVGGNFAGITANASVTIDGVNFVGTLNSADTAQDGALVNGVNNVEIANSDFSGLYNGVHVAGGTTASFYNRWHNLKFYTGINAFIKTDGSSSPGVDFTASDIQFLTSGNAAGTYPSYWMELDNLGSSIMTNVRGSGYVGTAGIDVNSVSSLAGVQQWDALVSESQSSGPGLLLGCTSSLPCNYVTITNGYIGSAGSSGVQAAEVINYATLGTYTGTEWTGANRGIECVYVCSYTSLEQPDFQTANVPVGANNGASIGFFWIDNPNYTGSYSLVYLSNLSAANYANPPSTSNPGAQNISITGGTISTLASPYNGPANSAGPRALYNGSYVASDGVHFPNTNCLTQGGFICSTSGVGQGAYFAGDGTTYGLLDFNIHNSLLWTFSAAVRAPGFGSTNPIQAASTTSGTMTYIPPVYNAGGGAVTSTYHGTQFTCAFSASTSCTVALTAPAAFTSSSSYSCSVSDIESGTVYLGFAVGNKSATGFTIYASASTSYTVAGTCWGS